MKELQDILKILEQIKREQQKAALATVIGVKGSAYRKPGARMLITSEGLTFGMVSGGCLDNDVSEHAKQVMQSGQSRIVTYDTTTDEDLLWGFGLGCQGIVEILIEPLEPEREYFPLNFLAHEQPTILATVIQVEGLVNAKLGAHLILRSPGIEVSDIDEPKIMPLIISEAQKILFKAKSITRRYALPSGFIDVFIEVIPPPLSLLIFGAGNDALPLVQFAQLLGWKVSLVDCRANEASYQRFDHAHRVILTGRDRLQQDVKIQEQSVVIIMTHNYFDDLAILKWLCPLSLRYLGLLGSQKRSERLLQDLQKQGIFSQQTLFSPIGLDIGATTPEEIALAIIAEIQAVISQCSGGFLKERSGMGP
jgi:xanthine/CO dehydrogenase XdhC/CoxF family maturation factor